MAKSEPNQDEILRLYDLLLLQQVSSVDLRARKARQKSRDKLQALFVDLQKVLAPQLTLEIGANWAMFSQQMARLGADAHAFEANPYNHEVIAPRIERKAPGVRYHHLAVSDLDGEVTFQVKKSRKGQDVNKVVGNNSLLVRTDTDFDYDSVTVPSVRLDSFLKSNGLEGRQFSAWIDVKGALGKVTSGFGKSLENCISLIVEVEEVEYWTGQMLYFDVMRFMAKQGLVPVARDFEAAHQYNLVYLRKDVLMRPDVRLVLAKHFQREPSASNSD